MSRRSQIALALALFLFALNAWICHELFTAEFVNNLLSNEGAFSSIGRFFREHPLDHAWFPWFNGGMAIEYAYQPLLPALSGLTAALTGWPDSRALHFILALAYCCGPVTLFWLAWDWSESLALSFSAGLAYSLTSPAEWLVPVLRFFPGGHLGALRLQNLVFYGEGPHTVALALLPLAFLFLRRAIVRGGAVNMVMAGIAASAVALTNAFGAFGVALGAICIVLALGRGVRAVLITGVCSYLWISPWLPPSLILWIRRSAWSTGGLFQADTRSHLAIPALIAAIGLAWFLTRRIKGSFERFAILVSVWMCAIPLVYFWLGGLTIVPLSSRYQLELEMAVALLFGCALRWFWTRSPSALRVTLLVLLAAALTRQAIIFRRYAAVLVKPIDITKTVEYKVVDWLARNRPGERAMVSGDPEYIFNLFTDSPQLSAGHEPTAPNWIQQIAVFIVYTGLGAGQHDAEVSIFWLKAFGVHTIYVPGPASREHYHPIANPHKFDGLLPVLWHDEDDTIFAVPQRSGSMAHVIPREALVTRPPVHGLDLDPARAYVAALDDPSLPLATLRWNSPSRAVIDTTMNPGQLISVQETWMPGWQARANGRPVRVFGDKLGLIVIDPECGGSCHIDLFFGPTTEGWILRFLSLMVTFLALVVLVVRKRAGSRPTKT
ncbi:MAG TPA: hypothetical protein VHC72_20125 [Bryobacteraceae bacterium]|nr:hypothetical protein [Bryobacteraceae bacterium]